jgi:hypothetical protein
LVVWPESEEGLEDEDGREEEEEMQVVMGMSSTVEEEEEEEPREEQPVRAGRVLCLSVPAVFVKALTEML